ncbi:hypothetical protein BGZ49_008468 [Haplosporangium sp. Z 27]|nr:hypothetical protein BGZ49_008468 [Haplosporangium sp. Z 27]
MRFQTFALFAVVYISLLANADPAQVCTGELSCDAGFCCSRSGFCGRSSFHCSHSSGCNPAKGSCGIVLLDKQDLPRVIAYDQLDHTSIGDLAKKLTDEGSHLIPEDQSKNLTIDSFLEIGLADKQLMHLQPQSQPQSATSSSAPAATTEKPGTAVKAPITPGTTTNPLQSVSGASTIIASRIGTTVIGAFALILSVF